VRYFCHLSGGTTIEPAAQEVLRLEASGGQLDPRVAGNGRPDHRSG
jgi:hypothetical protein